MALDEKFTISKYHIVVNYNFKSQKEYVLL